VAVRQLEPQESILKTKRKEEGEDDLLAAEKTNNNRTTPTKEKPVGKFVWDSRTMMPDVIATRAKAIAVQAREEAAGRRVSYSKIWIKEFLKLHPNCPYTSNNLSVHYWYWNSRENGGGGSSDKKEAALCVIDGEQQTPQSGGGDRLGQQPAHQGGSPALRGRDVKAGLDSVRRFDPTGGEGGSDRVPSQRPQGQRWSPQMNKAGRAAAVRLVGGGVVEGWGVC
jgi:hypothetical protein